MQIIPQIKSFFRDILWETIPRDQNQSELLNQPDDRKNSVDPITGRDISDPDNQPSEEDGNEKTIYFESEDTEQAYLDMPNDPAANNAPSKPSTEDDRGN